MDQKLQNGDVLIIGDQPFMIIGLFDPEKGYKHCLMHLRGYDTDCFMKGLNHLKIGYPIFGEEMKIEMIIPKEKVNFNFSF